MTPRFLIRCIISNIFIICLILIDFIAKKAVRTETTLLQADTKTRPHMGCVFVSAYIRSPPEHYQHAHLGTLVFRYPHIPPLFLIFPVLFSFLFCIVTILGNFLLCKLSYLNKFE